MTDLRRDSPFADNRPGRTWIQGFLKRNSNISKLISQNLTVFRASVTQDNILGWFTKVEECLKKKDIFQVLMEPLRLFNCDETAFFLNPKGNKVLAGKGDKTIYQQVNSDDKECLTVLITVITIVEGNEDTAIAGQSNIPSPFKKYILRLPVGKKKLQKKKPKERIPAIVSGGLGHCISKRKWTRRMKWKD